MSIRCLLALVLIAEVAVAAPITFRYKPDVAARSVSLAGQFNQWDMGATPMEDHDGIWTVTIDLAPGTYQYKFVVNASDWMTDEWATDFADDGFGGQNSVVTIGDDAMDVGYGSREGGPGGDALAREPGTEVTFRFATSERANAVSVAGDFNDWNAGAAPMSFNGGGWSVTLELDPGTHAFQFVIDGDTWVDMDGFATTEPNGFGGRRGVIEVGDEPVEIGFR